MSTNPSLRQSHLFNFAVDADSDDGGFVNRQRIIEEMIPEAVTMIQAHQLDLGSDAPTICICDSGYALGHPDLPQPPQVQGTNMVLNNGRVLKWDEDHTGHGTESASIIAAVEGNDQGLRGASPGVRLHITRGLDDDKRSTVSQMFRAIQQCVEAGAQIINLSLGCPTKRTAGVPDASVLKWRDTLPTWLKVAFWSLLLPEIREGKLHFIPHRTLRLFLLGRQIASLPSFANPTPILTLSSWAWDLQSTYWVWKI